MSASKLNRTSTLLNGLVRTQDRLGPTPAAVPLMQLFELEVKSIDNGARTMIGVAPGSAAQATANEYTIKLQPIFTELSRAGINYVYTSLNARTADGTENQEITPGFVVGEQFYVIFSQVSTDILFLGDGRMWAQV
jgi:hypothetical protein